MCVQNVLTLFSNIILRLLRGTLGLSFSSASPCTVFSASIPSDVKFLPTEQTDVGGLLAAGVCGDWSEEKGCSASQRFFSALSVPQCSTTPSTDWKTKQHSHQYRSVGSYCVWTSSSGTRTDLNLNTRKHSWAWNGTLIKSYWNLVSVRAINNIVSFKSNRSHFRILYWIVRLAQIKASKLAIITRKRRVHTLISFMYEESHPDQHYSSAHVQVTVECDVF